MQTIEIVQQYTEAYRAIQARLAFIPPDHVPNRVFLAWEKGELLVPAWTENEKAVSRLWVNVCIHMATVAVLAHSLASALTETLEQEGSSLQDVTEAALVHDAFKRYEQEAIATAKVSGWDAAKANWEAEAASMVFLQRAVGIEGRIAELAGMTGDHGIDHFWKGEGTTLAEMIFFYADCCTSGNHITTYRKKFDAQLPYFQPGERYDHVNQSFLTRYGKTHREVFDSVVIPVQTRIAAALDFEGEPETIPLAVTPPELHL